MPRICWVEDTAVAHLEPITLTRAAFELVVGSSTLAHKAERFLTTGWPSNTPIDRGAVVRSYLAPWQRVRFPDWSINDPSWLGADRTLVIHARWHAPEARLEFSSPGHGDSPWIGLCEGQPACAWVSAEDAARLDPHGIESWFETMAAKLPSHEVGGVWTSYLWDLVARNADEIVRDFIHRPEPVPAPGVFPHAAVVGRADWLKIDPSVRLDPYTVLDTTNGPISIEAGVWVQPFTRIEGPCHIGRDTQLFRANLRGGVTLGPNCRIGGEVEHSVVFGHSNKYHEGFLGHAYVGEWVNLGAITSNSDLRNDYGEVFVPLGGDPVATSQRKVGCFLGDHTRTGLGSMLNTGTTVGVMCNVLPAGPLLPKHVPSFTAILYGKVAPGFPLDQMFVTARTVKGRRGQEFSLVEEQLFLDLYEQTRLERERAFHRSQQRREDPWPTVQGMR